MPSSAPKRIIACSLGKVNYVDTWALQKRLQSRLIEAKRSSPKEDLPNLLLLVEHDPVYTLGKSGDPANLLVDDNRLTDLGAEFHQIDRGGDITFHGPGQLVGYPILDLDRFFTDIHRYLRSLEEVFIRVCRDWSVEAERSDLGTGVWIPKSETLPLRKICAMGIRISRWVTMHGFAFNANTRLSWFDHMVPCGINDGAVTSLASEIGESIQEVQVVEKTLEHFEAVFEAEMIHREGAAAFEMIEEILAGTPTNA